MLSITDRQFQIIEVIKNVKTASFRDVMAILATYSERTLKRELSDLVNMGVLIMSGGGRSVVYTVTILGRLSVPIIGETYAVPEPESRLGALQNYQFGLWQHFPTKLFSDSIYREFETLTTIYQESLRTQSADIRKRELERFIIELSWKSSRIEGNTYTFLDTERLLREGVSSSMNSVEETQMILNHKEAFDFVISSPLDNGKLTQAYIESLHTHLMRDLLVDMDWRRSGVGITGSTYHPLDNQFQIVEALDDLLQAIERMATVYDKALLCLCGISYIQPFVDGNKRTARLLANALLLSGMAAPLSYRSIDEVHYRSALLAFYEQLSIMPMQKIFTEQYEFAAKNYH